MRAYRTILWTIIIVIVSVFIAISLQSPFSIADEGAGPVISEGGDDSVAPSEGSLEGNEEEAVVSSEDAAETPADEATVEKDKKEADKAEAERGVQAAGTTGGDEGGPGAGVVSVPVLQNLVFTGAATAEIPIIVPPGRGGTAPKLALRYNSYRGNGWLGVGWDLDLGAIQRSVKWGLDYEDTDFVAVVNGSSSELVPRPDWGAGLYSAKIEGEFAKYYLNPSTNGWEVTAKDGTRYYYGTTAASRQDSTLGVFGWHLDRVEDPNGNYLTVTYTKDQGQIYPDRIDYTGNASGLNPTNYVKFYLEARTDVYSMYTTNAEVRTAYRLKTVEVVATGVRVRAYKITYTDSEGTSRSLLASVQQYGSDAALDASGTIAGGTALPALTCAYAPEFNGTYTAGPYSKPMHSGTYGAAGWQRAVGDVDGDGKTDIIFSWASTSGGILVRAMLSNGDGTYTAGPYSKPMSTGAYGAEGWCRMVGDVNGDGKADLIFSLAIDTSYGMQVRALLSNGDGTYTAGAYSKPMDSGAYGAAGWYRMVGDVNGDGKTDLIFSWAISTSNGIEVRSVLSNKGDNNLLTSLSNGLGGTVAIEYTPSSQYQNTLLPFILQPVSAITVDDGLGNQSVTTYSYEGGLYSFETRDFRGFARVVQTNPDKTIEETRFLQDEYRQGRQYQVDLSAPEGGALLAQTTLAWDTYPETPPEGAWAFVKLAQRRTEYYDAETVYAQEAYTYDDTTGNRITTTTSGTDAEAVTTAYQYQNYSAWLWRQTKETITGAITGKVRETTYEYDTKGNRTSESRWLDTGESPETDMTYDPYGNKITESDPRGNTTSYTYETVAYTYPAVITSPSTGGASHIVENETYDYRFGKVTRTRDENDNLTSYVYDLFGRLSQIDHPDGGQQVIEYYDNVFPRYTITKVKEQAGQTIDAYTFSDGLDRETQRVTFGEGGKAIVTKKHYDAMGRLALKEGPFFGAGTGYPQQPPAAFPWERTSYDYRGRPVLIERPDGEHTLVTTGLSYQGFMTTTTDPDNSQRTEVKDYLGRIIQVTEHVEAGQQHTLYDYDAAGDLVRVIDALGNQTLMTYDTLGRRIAMDDPDMGQWIYTYDANGNLLTQRDAKAQTITLTYDELNRIISKTYSTSDPAVTYTYDSPSVPHGIGRLASVSSTNATTAYIAYDPMGRVKGITKTIVGDGARATGYDYDLAGKTIRTTYPDGYQASYAYYPGSGLLATVTGSDAEVYAACTLYEPTGKMGQVAHGNGAATRYTYDPSSTRLYGIVTTDPSGQPANDIQRRSYSYTRAGDIAGIVDDLRGITYAYTYDKLHRLLAETNTGSYAPISYTYNAIGNILSKTVGAGTYAYTYDTAHKHAVKTITYNSADHTYTYDLNGNMINGPDFTDPGNIATRAITYNADNMPLRIVHPQATVDFVYDGNGTRTKKVVQGESTTYYVSEHFEVIGGVATKYIFAGNLRVAMVKGSQRSYFHKDHLGSSTAMTDASGAKVETTEYVPYGEMRAHTGAEVTNYKLTDQELDPESGLYNYDARLYDPAIGRFITPDSMVPDVYDPQALNHYSYCRNNPLIYVDPSGHWFLDWLFGNGGTSNSNYSDYYQRNYLGHNATNEQNWEGLRFSTATDQYSLSLRGPRDSSSEGIRWGSGAGGARSATGTPWPWLFYAESQLGVKEIAGSKNNDIIVSYHKTTGGFKDDETPWCSSFLNWSMIQSDIKGTNNALALSWLAWGQQLNKPAYASIGIIDYGRGRGHVGFVVGLTKSDSIVLLGGNQSDSVQYSAFSREKFVSFVYPSGYIPSYVLPVININNIMEGSYGATR